jgi:hypothetical protein
MSTPIPFYRLRDLIEERYGPHQVQFGCMIVARFVTFETKQEVTLSWMISLCSAQEHNTMLTPQIAAVMVRLFELHSARELFSFPEHIPADFIAEECVDVKQAPLSMLDLAKKGSHFLPHFIIINSLLWHYVH